MDYYLGQPIELVETNLGWVSIWHHQLVGQIEVKYFKTPQDALGLMTELIRRDLTAVSLMKVVDDWYDTGLVDDLEHEVTANSLVQSVLAVLNPQG